MRFIGVHLIQPAGEKACPVPTTIAVVDDDGALQDFHADIANRRITPCIGGGPSLVVLDAPISVPNARGRRPVEQLLAWCDINLFPVARDRLMRVFGGIPGESVADALEAAGHTVAETHPAVALRQLAWEADRTGRPPMTLAAYREAWLGTRTPRLSGLADGDPGLRSARAVLPLSGDVPLTAAAIAALTCAFVGLRGARPDLGGTLAVPVGPAREFLLPAGPELLGRAALHQERLNPT